jgi:hypothetical protein
MSVGLVREPTENYQTAIVNFPFNTNDALESPGGDVFVAYKSREHLSRGAKRQRGSKLSTN